MSQAISPQHPAVVLRSHYLHLRALLALSIITIVGLTTAVVVLATSDRVHTTTIVTAAPGVGSSSQTADTGARLDHRGLSDRLNSLSQTADTGARLDHRGLKDRPRGTSR